LRFSPLIDCATRGIPSGYLSYIEQRLLDTEIVVFELLSATYNSQVPIHRLSEIERRALADLSQKQPKSAKIEEWKRSPLNTEEQRHDWWSKRCESILPTTQPGTNRPSQDAMTPQDTWADASPLSVQYEDVQTYPTMRPPSAACSSQSAVPLASWQQTLNMPLSSPEATFDNSVPSDPRSSMSLSNTGGDASGMILRQTAQAELSRDSGSLNAERWRKYF
jgi:hypothetical protein